MKFSYQQLPMHLKSNLLPVYLITGNELFLVQEARELIRSKAKSQGFSEVQRYEVNKDFDWSMFVESNNTYSLFSDKVCTEIKLNQKPNAAGSKLFTQFLENHDPNKILLITTDKLESATQRSGWAEAINKIGAIVTIWPLDSAQFKQWALHRLRANNLNCDQAGLQFLVDQTEGNLLALAQEIEKLKLIFEGAIKLEDLINATTDNARFDIFSCIDIIEQGNASRILRSIRKLKAEAVEPTLLLWALSREIRSLSAIIGDLKNKSPWATLVKKHQIWEKRQPSVKKMISLHTPKSLHTLLLQAERIDHIIKGVTAGNVWSALETLALGLGGHQQLSLITSSPERMCL
ncbi:MAG: DNA polymerase III subunit delta [Gammaproteobacteria bacterium]|nr:DNA polymerase III subunit delta [Gammaproteobacteria bacterium]